MTKPSSRPLRRINPAQISKPLYDDGLNGSGLDLECEAFRDLANYFV